MKKVTRLQSDAELIARLDAIEADCGDLFPGYSRLLVAAGKAARLASVISAAVAHDRTMQDNRLIADAAAEVEITLHAVRSMVGNIEMNTAKHKHLTKLEKRVKDSKLRARKAKA